MALIHLLAVSITLFVNPMGVTVKGDTIFLVEAGQFGAPDGRVLRSKDGIEWKVYAAGLFDPKSVAVYNDSALVVVDKNGVWLVAARKALPFVSTSDFPVPTNFIRDIAVGPDGRIYIPDLRSSRIFAVNPDRTVDSVFAVPKVSCVTVSSDTTIYFATYSNPGMVFKLKDGKASIVVQDHELDKASSMVLDEKGNALFVASRTTGKIVRIDLFVDKAQLIDTVNFPGDMTISPDGKFLVIPLTRSGAIKKIPIR